MNNVLSKGDMKETALTYDNYMILCSSIISLTDFTPMFHFYPPWKQQKTRGFQPLSRGMEKEHWRKLV